MVTPHDASHSLALRILYLALLKSCVLTTGLQSAQQDLKLPRVLASLFKGHFGGLRSFWFVSSKWGSALFLVSTPAPVRSQSSACSKSLLQDLCPALLFSQQGYGKLKSPVRTRFCQPKTSLRNHYNVSSASSS